jgi:hypothetical protein
MAETTQTIICARCGKPVLECWCFAEDGAITECADPSCAICAVRESGHEIANNLHEFKTRLCGMNEVELANIERAGETPNG